MLPHLLAAALFWPALDPVEVATRHEAAGRTELALHLLDVITSGGGDAAAQAVRERLKARLGRQHTDNNAPPSPKASAAPVARATPAPAAPGEDAAALFKAGQYARAARLFRAALEANPHDFNAFSYLTGCYWRQAEALLADGNRDKAAKVYDEGLRVERMYAPAFADELHGSTAPEDLAARVGR